MTCYTLIEVRNQIAIMVSEILIARHGETDWNQSGRWQGHTDRPLNENGYRQAQSLAAKLSDGKLDAVYSSDLTRARVTAEVIANSAGVTNIGIDNRLRERNLGTLEGLTTAEICSLTGLPRNGVTIKGISAHPSVEAWDSFIQRVSNALDDIRKSNPDNRVLVVAHGGVMIALSMYILDDYETPRTFTNGEVIKLYFDHGWNIHFSNSTR